MDPEERECRIQEFELAEREFRQRDQHHARQQKLAMWTTIATIFSLFISAAGLSLAFWFQARQSQDATEQFQRSWNGKSTAK